MLNGNNSVDMFALKATYSENCCRSSRFVCLHLVKTTVTSRFECLYLVKTVVDPLDLSVCTYLHMDNIVCSRFLLQVFLKKKCTTTAQDLTLIIDLSRTLESTLFENRHYTLFQLSTKQRPLKVTLKEDTDKYLQVVVSEI